MRNLLMMAAGVTIVAAMAACSETDPTGSAAAPAGTATPATAPTETAPAPTVSMASTTELRFDVQGMHCGGCANTVAATLRKMEGVVDCQATFESQEKSTALVEVSDPALAPAVRAAVEKMGYTVTESTGS